jgi:glycosyltransferase involved in cell wall biosynthesis
MIRGAIFDRHFLFMTPQVTVGMAFYNPGVDFELAIKSVFAQTFTDWELVLVDDGSIDGSLEFAQSIADPRVRVYSDGKNMGASIRMNEVIQQAQTPYLIRMDADDVLHPQRIEIQYAELLKYGNDAIVGTATYSIDTQSQVLGFTPSKQFQSTGYAARHDLVQPTVAASIEWFRNHPYSKDWVYRRCEDAELWCRASVDSKYINMEMPLVYYREVGNYSLKKQMATYFGLFNLIYDHHFKQPWKFSALLGKELFRLFLIGTLTSFGKSNWFISRRYRPLTAAQKRHAEAGLEIVRNQVLPIRHFSVGESRLVQQ